LRFQAISSRGYYEFRWQVTDYSLRLGQYGRVDGANLFKAHLARALYELCGIDAAVGGTGRILDPCAGWGDRLVGALATPGCRRYLAFDPNPALVPAHGEAIRTLLPMRAKLLDPAAVSNPTSSNDDHRRSFEVSVVEITSLIVQHGNSV
jgi:hypothetical protein